MVSDVLKDLQAKPGQGIEALKKDLGKVRTGRANVAILDGLRVDYYGTPTPLNQVSSVSAPDPRLITIKPWEKSLIPEIEKVIRSSSLGLNPSSDGEIVRLPMPPLTEEPAQRSGQDGQEDGRGLQGSPAQRPPRRQRDAEGVLKDKDITEDEEKAGLKKVQEATDAAVTKVDDVVAKKDKEIMEI